MFSIAAINDTDSREQWEPLAPTKEAQEFHLTQAYHEGLLKLESKEYVKAQELLESVLKDPLISDPQVDSDASDGHLLQLRFLALKNLANVFLQQGPAHYEGALRCYLQAVEIDTKDSVVWNQLGTLSCSMGSLSISRWAFEQGLLCSPNNWNCMEKLLEVLIAIGDEVACLSVAELILQRWPSHSRARHVKNTIEEPEPVPFAPRGIDKLEPKHVRLKFPDKRKATDQNIEKGVAKKKPSNEMELFLPEVSWVALIDAILDILLPLNVCGSNRDSENVYRSGDVRLKVHLPSSDAASGHVENKMELCNESIGVGGCNLERANDCSETNSLEEHPHERRSTRLKSRKPGKEELDFASSKDLVKDVLRFVEPFVVDKTGKQDSDHVVCFGTTFPDLASSLEKERDNVFTFVREASKNYGAYHLGHLLLEHAASGSLLYHDVFAKFLQLEKLTRSWGQDRTPECSLLLAELYYDLGSLPCNSSRLTEFISEASYHLCKIVESVALGYPFDLTHTSWKQTFSLSNHSLHSEKTPGEDLSFQDALANGSFTINKRTFWIRYFWLCGRLSISDGNRAKAHEEFCISLSLMEKIETTDNSQCSVHLPHLKINKEITKSKILYEVNMQNVDFLLEKTVGEMIEKEMYVECINLLSPLLFSMEDVDLDASPLLAPQQKDEKFTYTELSALDILINACEKTNLKDTDIHLNCHQRKLKLLMILAGMDENGSSHQKLSAKSLSPHDVYGKEALEKDWDDFVAEEVKAISQCASLVKNVTDQSSDSNCVIIPNISISNIQCLLLTFMCHLAINHLGKKSSVALAADGIDQKQRSSFVDACTAFCKLQHLIITIPVKTQVELIIATHNLLAEYGLCCSGGIDGEEGLFLKFAIKHLLALDMKLKSNSNSSNQQCQQNKQSSMESQNETPKDEPKSDKLDLEMGGAEADQNSVSDDRAVGGIMSNIRPFQAKSQESAGLESNKQCCEGDRNIKQPTAQSTGNEDELSEDEREELELSIENALDQCFFCLYGLNLRSDASYEDDLVMHKNTSRGDYQTKEQCVDVFQYVLPYAKASTRTGLIKLRRVLRAIRKHFLQPPEAVLTRNAIDNFLDDPDLSEDKLSEEAGCEGFLETITNVIFPHGEGVKDHRILIDGSSEPYLEVYSNLYYFLAQSEETNATDKWTGFVLTKEGEEFVQQNANLFKYDLLYNPLRFESWQRLATIYDEEVDLLLNDGSKHINVAGWRKNSTLPQRVEASRRRSRRCLLMSLALAKASSQQSEIHELLALVYYDSLQNVVPFYDQRSVVPTKNAAWTSCCEISLRHFKKAFSHKEDWSHAFYMGKLCEKLGYAYETSLTYYDKAISLNPSAVDPFYRMHASRLKLLFTHGQQSVEALKVLSQYSYSQSVKDAVTTTFGKFSPDASPDTGDMNNSEITNHEELEVVWHMLYKDCLSALEICIEGDLKHFHKARFMLAQGLYKRGLSGDLGRAKEELSFCFKSSRSSFTINMWEIDGLVKKGRRKTPGFTGSKKVLEVNLPESSRKFITCIRKYLLLYLILLEETGDVGTLDRAFLSLRADKRFSLCVEDLVPMALGRHIKTLVSSMHQEDSTLSGSPDSSKHKLEKMFSLFLEQGNLWPEVLSLPELSSPEMSEKNLYGYLHQYIALLESNGKLDTLEAIQEKLRKRFKNPKLSNSSCAKVCRHASISWCRYLILNLAMITPQQAPVAACNSSDSSSENSHLLYVDLESNELWNSSSEDITRSENLESKWAHVLSKMKRIVVRKVSSENFDTANCLLRSSYSFYKESSFASLPSGVNLYLVPSQLAMETQFQLGSDGVEILDVSIPRKLLLWAYALLHGRYVNISSVVKYCEENVKPKVRKGAASPAITPNTSTPLATPAYSGTSKESVAHGGSRESEITPVPYVTSFEGEIAGPSSNTAAETTTLQKGSDSGC